MHGSRVVSKRQINQPFTSFIELELTLNSARYNLLQLRNRCGRVFHRGMYMSRLSFIPAFGLVLTLVLPGVQAQNENESGDDDDGKYIEEIVVTAEKREENVLEVPVTMSAFNDQMIEELGMTSQDDLEQLVAGLQFQDNGQQTGQGTTIRGIGTRLAGESHADLAVATYVDGAYTLGTYGVAPNMFDLERIEVARGPQGTLNGRNSIAGSISYHFRKPTDEWDLLLHSELTDQFTQRYGIAFGGPISENVSFRINGSYYEGDGAQKNIGLGGDYDAPDQKYIAPQLRFKTDRMDLNVRYSKLDDDGSPRTQILLSEVDRNDPDGNENFDQWRGELPSVPDGCPPGRPAFLCGDIKNEVNLNRSGESGGSAEQGAISFSYELSDQYSLRYNYGDTNNFSTVFRDRDMTNRVSSTSDPFIASDAPVPFSDAAINVWYDYTESSHELQLVSHLEGGFNYIVGLFTYENTTEWYVPVFNYTNVWRHETADEAARAAGFANCQEIVDTILIPWELTTQAAIDAGGRGNYWQCPDGNDHTQTLLFGTTASSETKAAFVNAEYEFSDLWQVSGGLRFTEDVKNQGFQGGFFIGDFGFIGGGRVPIEIIFDDSDPNTRTWNQPIGHISLEYTPVVDRLLYGRISTGYRAGGFNSKSAAAPAFIKEETLVNYEAGMKGLFMDGRLQLSSGVFFNDFNDYQITGLIDNPTLIPDPFSDTPIVEFTDNIEDTKIWGAEVEFIFALAENWRLSGFYAYLDSKIGEHFEVIRGHPNPQTGTYEHIDFESGERVTSEYILPSDMTGHQLPMQPNHKFAISAIYERQLDIGGNLQLLGTYSWVDDRASDLSNLQISTLPAYSRTDIRGTWTSDDERLSATLFVQNLFDEIGLIEFLLESTNSAAPSSGTLTQPRQFGLEVRWRPSI